MESMGEMETVLGVVCPSCGEVYDTPEQIGRMLHNSGFCTNLTCLQDLSAEPFDAIRFSKREGRRASDLHEF